MKLQKKEAVKITLDDIFQVIKKISKNLPKKDFSSISINKLNTSHFINSIEKIKVNIPPYNQSSMDGYGVINKSIKYENIGSTSLNRYINYKIKKNQCIEVKTGSLIPNNINYIIPLEYVFKHKNEIHCINYKFKEKYIRPKGHIFKKNTLILRKNSYLNIKDLSAIKSLKNLKVKIQNPLSFSIISTGSEFTKDHFIKPTNGEYLKNFLLKNNQRIDNCIHIKDDHKLLNKYLNKFKSNIVIVIGGTGKSRDDIQFENKNLIINGINLKPGRPFKYFYKNTSNYLFFPGNPCSSFVLTNILIKELIKLFYEKKTKEIEEINISNLDFNFRNLKRKTFLFALKFKENFKIFKNQESSNLANILNANYLLYFNQTNTVRAFNLND